MILMQQESITGRFFSGARRGGPDIYARSREVDRRRLRNVLVRPGHASYGYTHVELAAGPLNGSAQAIVISSWNRPPRKWVTAKVSEGARCETCASGSHADDGLGQPKPRGGD